MCNVSGILELNICEADILISMMLMFQYLVNRISKYLVKWIFKSLGDIQMSAQFLDV